ncbi:MAG: PSD1 and planctomycete cytochrome C domain-containing protein [Fuerstiella sp.]
MRPTSALFLPVVALYCLCPLLLAVAGGSAVAGKRPAAAELLFERDIYPILQRACIECHGADRQEGELRLDRRADAFESGVIEPGQPEASELLRRITLPRGHDEIMPAIGDPLSSGEVKAIRAWIESGADWPDDFKVRPHWAYVAPVRPDLPSVSRRDWCQSPLDYFVLSRLEEEGLQPSPPAMPEKLLRRVFLDLIGLPPTPAEVQAFLDDPSAASYERVVDELLQRPQFGERWARPWLDLARYADSHGFQRDNLRDVWAYRDWVIRALNRDMPFDQFTIRQVAGDLLPEATEADRIATGFHRCTPTNVEAGSLPEETRIEQVLDRVNTTGAVWLGTTLECCQCHDHKYDPFTTTEYYQLLAFFNSTQQEADRTNPNQPSSIQFQGPSMPLQNAERDGQRMVPEQQLKSLSQQQAELRSELAGDLDSWAAELSAELADAEQTHRLQVIQFESEGTTDSHQLLDDGSILLVGDDPPDTDVYRIRVRTQQQGIRAFRLEALRHESLPGGGPGRGDPQRRNFVLNDVKVELVSAGRTSKLPLTSATAGFSQNNWPVSGAIDEDRKTGWAIAPKFDQSHTATFIVDEPVNPNADSELVFTLDQRFGQARTIGCLRLSAVTGNVGAESVPEEIVNVAATPATEWSKQDRTRLLEYRLARHRGYSRLSDDVARLRKQIEKLAPDTTLVMVELPEPRPSAVFERGDYRNPGQPVEPGTPSVLHPLSAKSTDADTSSSDASDDASAGPANRLTLARWLVSRENPLVARVTVNRWWAEIFGRGIVTTPEDFGIKGDRPSHPQLLDWLAVEFMDSGWSMKRLLKTIVTSATYQQTSHLTPRLLALDDQNRLLARGPRFRMEAEMIRDNSLAISGLLNLKQFGPPIRPYQPDGLWRKVGGTAYNYEVSPGSEQHRRGIYVVLKRGSPYPSFINFDATARLACTVSRSRTNTPLQALTLLNDPVYVEAARGLVTLVLTEQKNQPIDEQLKYAFRRCTARLPSAQELAALRALIPEPSPSKGDSDAAAEDRRELEDAWFKVATVLLNLHETVTKD